MAGQGLPWLVWVLHCCPDKGSPVPPHNYSLSASLSISAADFLPAGSLSRDGTERGWKVDERGSCAWWGRVGSWGLRERPIWFPPEPSVMDRSNKNLGWVPNTGVGLEPHKEPGSEANLESWNH